MRRKMLFAIFIAGILLSIFPVNAENSETTAETIIPDEEGHLPNIPSNPSPPNNAVNVAIDVTLSWKCSDEDGDIIIYDIYFEENDSTPDIKIASTMETSYHLNNLKYSTTYYWRIGAKDKDGAVLSPVWKFTTQGIEIIKVAILLPYFVEEWELASYQIMYILNYSWNTSNKTYKFSCDILSYSEVLNNLNYPNYKVFIIPGIPTGYIAGIFPSISSIAGFKAKVREFVSNGGGYFGICGGAASASSGVENPDTPMEWLINKAALGLIPSKIKQDFANPITGSLVNHPEKVGQSAWLFYNESEGTSNENNAFGVTVNLNVDKNHPLFKNLDLSKISQQSYDGNRLRIRWWGGPGFETNGIAFYSEEISEMSNAKLHVWKYVGNISINQSIISNFSNPTDEDLEEYLGWVINFSWVDLEDYIKLNETIETNLIGKGAIAYANYGNGRVLAFGPHPEDSIWDGGQIVESEDTSNNSLAKGLYHWEGSNVYDWELNHWLIKRGVALVAGVPENELPYTKINHPPNKPINPNPADGATGISINPTLSWQCSDIDNDILTYDVYFGTSPNPPKVATVTTTSYNPGTLSYSTTYYWRVVAKDGQYENSSDLWHFTTISNNHPPYQPSNPNPPVGYIIYINSSNNPNNQELVSQSLQEAFACAIASSPSQPNESEVYYLLRLSWQGGDPDRDVVTYYVYLEKDDSTPDILIATTTSTVVYYSFIPQVGTYYWRVVAKDSKGAISYSNIWYFYVMNWSNN